MEYLILGTIVAITAVSFFSLHVLGKKSVLAISKKPHKCPDGEFWMPVTKTVSQKVADIGQVNVAIITPDGQAVAKPQSKEYVVVRFMGVACGRCSAVLECKSCGKTPSVGSVVEDQLAQISILSCCEDPVFGDKR